MISITLSRAFMDSKVTLGMLRVTGIEHPPIYTLELPWLGNKANVSCIPVGRYKCGPHNSAKYKDVFAVRDVPGRTGILIHAGNRTADIQGCILVGLAAGTMNSEPAVLESRRAIEALRFILGSEPFSLSITQP